MVREHDRPDPVEHRHVAEEARADGWVSPHLDPLVLGKLGRFGKQRLGDADLSDVVEERAELDRRDLVRTECELSSDLDRVVHRRRRVPAEVLLLRLERPDQRADHREVRLLEPIVRLAQELVDRAELLVPLADLG